METTKMTELDLDQTTSDRVISAALDLALVTTRLLRAWHSGEIDSRQSIQMLWESLGLIRGFDPGESPATLLTDNEHQPRSDGRTLVASTPAFGADFGAVSSQASEEATE